MTLAKIAPLAWVIYITMLVPAHSDPNDRPEELKSGYHYSRQDTRDIQDDSFSNPGFIYLQRGEHLWRMADGDKQKSCSSCHGDAKKSMRGVGAEYPKLDKKADTLVNLGQRIQICRTKNMTAPRYEPPEHETENKDLLSLESYIMLQSEGLPLSVMIGGAAAPYFERGRALYHTRIGQSDLACSQCHNENVGGLLRAERISQGHVNGFPTYVLRWDRMASAHRRFQYCNQQARAEPLPLNHPDYNALQLYVAWRGTGLPIEIPAVRR